MSKLSQSRMRIGGDQSVNVQATLASLLVSRQVFDDNDNLKVHLLHNVYQRHQSCNSSSHSLTHVHAPSTYTSPPRYHLSPHFISLVPRLLPSAHDIHTHTHIPSAIPHIRYLLLSSSSLHPFLFSLILNNGLYTDTCYTIFSVILIYLLLFSSLVLIL